MKKNLFLFSIIVLFSCSQNESDNGVRNISVDETAKINFTDLFKEYKLIFPESKDSAWFGLNIERIEKYHDKLFLLNNTQRAKNILCFDTDGHFLFNIDKLGNGPGEYTDLSNFMIDKQLNAIVLDVFGNQYGFYEYMYFSIDGEYLYSKESPK
jgi:hypothetical protein